MIWSQLAVKIRYFSETDRTMNKLFVILGAINGLLAVAFGAFAAHGLRSHLSERLYEVFQTGVQYHAMHALALLMIGILASAMPRSPWLITAGWSMLAGILLFSGSLYLLAVSGIPWLGMVTPFGGMALLIGWGMLAWAAWRQPESK